MELDPVGKDSERFYGNVDVPDAGYSGVQDGKPRLVYDHPNENIDVHGTLQFADDSLLWDDLQVNISGVRLPAVGAPTWTAYKGSYILSFSKTQDNVIYFASQLPHSYKQGSDLDFHLHLAYPLGGVGDCRWVFTHSWASMGKEFQAETTVITDIASPNQVDRHQFAQIADPIVGSGQLISSMLLCSLMREGTDPADDYDEVVLLAGLDFHFQKDTVGSREEATK